jgi:hypothetical protein
MIPKDLRELYQIALGLWGGPAQVFMCIEEMAELMKELSKDTRGKGSKERIAEEIADVEIMLEQMKILYGCEELTESYKEVKAFRLSGLVGYEGYKPNHKPGIGM